MKDGFVKVAAASPVIRLADCEYNAGLVVDAIRGAAEKGVKILVFPELTLTGATCGDLLGHRVLLDGAARALEKVVEASEGVDMLIFVGLPFAFGAKLLSVAAVVYDGGILGLVPREDVSGTPFSVYEGEGDFVRIGPYESCLCPNTLFTHASLEGLAVAVELGSDSNEPVSPAMTYALEGATLVAQMACFPETLYSTAEAKNEIRALSRRLKCALVLAAPGLGESTTDNSYSGLCLVAENGELLAWDERADSLAVSEIDVQYLLTLRRRDGGFGLPGEDLCLESWGGELTDTALTRHYRKYPQLPEGEEELARYCERMLDIQVSGLVKRMTYAHLDHCVVGISGGVDSTLAVLVSAMAVRRMGLPSENVIACTMPCFGTSSRTKSNAVVVAEQIGAEVRVIDISRSVCQHFDDIGHAHDDYSVAFENAQARERTQVLMDISNKVNGLDVGTEDLSEYIDGWCTYNGDHTSMYDVNLGLTKTQVRAAVGHIAQDGRQDPQGRALRRARLPGHARAAADPRRHDRAEERGRRRLLQPAGLLHAQDPRLRLRSDQDDASGEARLRRRVLRRRADPLAQELQQAPLLAAVQAQLPDGRPGRRGLLGLAAYGAAHALGRGERAVSADARGIRALSE